MNYTYRRNPKERNIKPKSFWNLDHIFLVCIYVRGHKKSDNTFWNMDLGKWRDQVVWPQYLLYNKYIKIAIMFCFLCCQAGSFK